MAYPHHRRHLARMPGWHYLRASGRWSVGWIYQYALVDTTGKRSLQELRSFQDWSLRFWLQSVPGVAEVASVGGFEKQ